MAYFIAYLTPLETEKEKQYLEAHLDYLNELREVGAVFANGRLIGETGGVIVYQTENIEIARGLLENDPYIIEKIRSYKLCEWAVKFKNAH